VVGGSALKAKWLSKAREIFFQDEITLRVVLI
jgi:hypothetical protein